MIARTCLSYPCLVWAIYHSPYIIQLCCSQKCLYAITLPQLSLRSPEKLILTLSANVKQVNTKIKWFWNFNRAIIEAGDWEKNCLRKCMKLTTNMDKCFLAQTTQCPYLICWSFKPRFQEMWSHLCRTISKKSCNDNTAVLSTNNQCITIALLTLVHEYSWKWKFIRPRKKIVCLKAHGWSEN